MLVNKKKLIVEVNNKKKELERLKQNREKLKEDYEAR